MNQLALREWSLDYDPACSDLLAMAERELAAFFGAMTKLFGSDQAGLSAEDWLHELIALRALPASAAEWRALTVKVAARLAGRMKTTAETMTPA